MRPPEAPLPLSAAVDKTFADRQCGAMAQDSIALALENAYASHDWGLARALCLTILPNEPSRAEAWFTLAAMDGSARGFARSAALVPTWANAWANLGRIAAATDPPAARRALRRAIALDPAPSLANMLGVVGLALGDLADAMRLLKRALAFAPDGFDICVHLGLVQLRLDERKAEPWFAAAVALGPSVEAALTNLGWRRLAGGAHEEALDWAERAMHAAPSGVDAPLLAATSLRMLSQASKAEEVLEPARARSPDSAAINLQLARINLDLRRLDRAYDALGGIYRREPGRLTEVREMLVTAPTGELWLDIGKLKARLGKVS